MKSNKLSIYIAIMVSACILFSGCGQKSSKPTGNEEKPPESLSQLEKNIDTIIDALDKEGKTDSTSQSQSSQKNESSQNTSNKSQQGSESSSGGQSSGQSQQGSSNQQQSQQQTQQPQQMNQQAIGLAIWESVDKTIKDTHKKWNEYVPEATKSGVSSDMINFFTADLNTLTNDIAGKNIMSTLNNANNLYKYIPEFLSHYSAKTVDVKRLKYYTRDVMYKSRYDKWDLADISMEKAKGLITNIRTQSKDETKTTVESLIFGINDLDKVVRERQKSLTQIKGNIILDNIKKLEKAIENESKQEDKNK